MPSRWSSPRQPSNRINTPTPSCAAVRQIARRFPASPPQTRRQSQRQLQGSAVWSPDFWSWPISVKAAGFTPRQDPSTRRLKPTAPACLRYTLAQVRGLAHYSVGDRAGPRPLRGRRLPHPLHAGGSAAGRRRRCLPGAWSRASRLVGTRRRGSPRRVIARRRSPGR